MSMYRIVLVVDDQSYTHTSDTMPTSIIAYLYKDDSTTTHELLGSRILL